MDSQFHIDRNRFDGGARTVVLLYGQLTPSELRTKSMKERPTGAAEYPASANATKPLYVHSCTADGYSSLQVAFL